MSSNSNATIITLESSDSTGRNGTSRGTLIKKRRRSNHESNFQRRFTSEAVVNMIRDDLHPSRVANYINTLNESNFVVSPGEQLFQKELTPSDVGRLNRLVIPKKHALKFFPPIPVGENGRGAEKVELTFQDRSMRIWKFRYCYWKRSENYVFTHGWNRFVDVNNLRPRDVLTFWRFKQANNTNEASFMHIIEVTHRNRAENGVAVESTVFSGVEGSNGNLLKREEDMGGDEEISVEKKKGFRLFGVQIM